MKRIENRISFHFSFLSPLVVIIIVAFFSAKKSYIDGETKADSTILLNQSSQILAALKSYKKQEGLLPTNLNQLVSHGLLTEVPTPHLITSNPYVLKNPENEILLYGISQDVCLTTQKMSEERNYSSVRAKCIQPSVPGYKDTRLLFILPLSKNA